MVMMPGRSLREGSRGKGGVPENVGRVGGSTQVGRKLGERLVLSWPEAAVGEMSQWNGEKSVFGGLEVVQECKEAPWIRRYTHLYNGGKGEHTTINSRA